MQKPIGGRSVLAENQAINMLKIRSLRFNRVVVENDYLLHPTDLMLGFV